MPNVKVTPPSVIKVQVGPTPNPQVSTINYGGAGGTGGGVSQLRNLTDVDASNLQDGFGIIYHSGTDRFTVQAVVTTAQITTINNQITALQAVNLSQNNSITVISNYVSSVNQLAQAAYDTANNAISGSVDPLARTIANTATANTVLTQGVDASQNTQISALQSVNLTQNTQISTIQGVDLTQNTQITGLQGGLDTVNTSISNIQTVNQTQNNNITIVQGGLNSANANISLLQSVINTSNANTILVQGGLNTANANIALLFGIETSQNTWISSNATITQAAFTQANSSNTFAQASFGVANSAQSNTVLLQGGLNSANANISLLFAIDNTQNANTVLLQGGLNTANANISLLFAIDTAQNTWISSNATITQASFDKANSVNTYAYAAFAFANTISGGSSADAFARNTANSAANTANSASANTILLQGGLNTANANISLLFAIDNSQNTWISSNAVITQASFDKANSVNTYAYSAYAYANSVNSYAYAAYAKANTGGSGSSSGYLANSVIFANSTGYLSNASALSFISSNNTLVVSNITVPTLYTTSGGIVFPDGTTQATAASGAATDTFARTTANNTQANTVLLQGGLNTANANIALLFAIDTYQNTITQAAFDKANTGTSGGSANTGNLITLGSNTTGVLVSNAATFTTSTTVTNSIATLNQILGKLVPASPATFPSTFGTLTITGTVGPFRMTNFTQTDNTGTGTASVAAGTSINPLRVAAYTTSTITNINTIAGDVISAVKNATVTGSRTITSGATNAGTYSDLVILTNVDYATITGIATGFWYSANIRASGTGTAGWNNISITDTNGSPTSNATWYYDNSAPGTPTFASASIVPATVAFANSSTIPHYSSSTTFRLGVNVSKLSGDLYPASDTFFTGTAGGAFAAPSSNTYTAAGITTPLARNLLVASGSTTVNTNSTIIAGFGSSATGPSVTVDNSYSTASQVFTTALGATVLYKTGNTSSNTVIGGEDNLFFGSTVGAGSGLAFRIANPGTTDTPVYTGTEAAFDSVNGPLLANDATCVAGTIKYDVTNYSTGYLPVGPNLSTGRGTAQYFTFKFIRTSVSKFDIRLTGTIAGMWVALPGSVIDTTSGLNGWMDMSTAYNASGHPGTNTGGNGSNGCALGGTVPLNSAITNTGYTCTFGDVSSSSTVTNEIYVRIKLTSGQSMSVLTLQGPSH